MDYDKETYFKISELERLIGNTQSLGVSGVPYMNGCPSGRKTTVATYTGGSALIIVSASSTGSGGIDVYFAGMRVSGLASGGTATTVFTATDGGEIELLPAVGVTVGDVYVSAFGTKCGFDAKAVHIAADFYGSNAYAAYASDKLEVHSLSSGAFTPLYYALIASDFDVACSGERTLIAFINGDGVGILTTIDAESSATLGKCAKIAATATDGGWAVAAYDGTLVTVTRYGFDLTPLESTVVRSSNNVTGMCFIKHADVLSLIISDNNRNILCISSDEAHAEASASVTVEIVH